MDGDVFQRAALVLVLVTLPVASLIAAHNLAQHRFQPAAARSKRPVLLFTTALALLAVLAATLAFAAPKHKLNMVAPSEEGAPAYIPLEISSAAVGVTAVVLSAFALAMDGVFTLHLYRVGHKLEFGEAPARWKIYLAHFYIWVLYIAPWVVLFAPTQVLLRKPNSSMMDHFYIPPGVFFLRMLSFILSFALQVVVSVVSVFVFVRSLNRLADNTLLDEARVRDLMELSIKSAIYVGACLALKFYLFIILLSYPWCLEADVLTTPFLLAHLLLVHCCFNVRYGEKTPKGTAPYGRRLRRWMWQGANDGGDDDAGQAGPAVAGAGDAGGRGSGGSGGSSGGSGGSSGRAGGRRPGLRSGSGSGSGGSVGTASISRSSGSSGSHHVGAMGVGSLSSLGLGLFRISEAEERHSSSAASTTSASPRSMPAQRSPSSPAFTSPLSLESGRQRRQWQSGSSPMSR